MNKKKNRSRTPTVKTKNSFIHRDQSNLFNLSFRIQMLDIKLLMGGYLSSVRAEQARFTQKDVAKKSGVSVRNLIYIETGYGASMDAVMQVYLYYVCTGVLPDERQVQFFDIYYGIWMRE